MSKTELTPFAQAPKNTGPYRHPGYQSLGCIADAAKLRFSLKGLANSSSKNCQIGLRCGSARLTSSFMYMAMVKAWYPKPFPAREQSHMHPSLCCTSFCSLPMHKIFLFSTSNTFPNEMLLQQLEQCLLRQRSHDWMGTLPGSHRGFCSASCLLIFSGLSKMSLRENPPLMVNSPACNILDNLRMSC